jgi:hypothetical protein
MELPGMARSRRRMPLLSTLVLESAMRLRGSTLPLLFIRCSAIQD